MASGVDSGRPVALGLASLAANGRTVHAQADYCLVGCRLLYAMALGKERLSCTR